MTIRKKLVISLIAISVGAIILNSILLVYQINKNFLNYMTITYNTNVNNIKDTTIKELEKKEHNLNKLAVNLEGYLDDPIIGVDIYNSNGMKILSVRNTGSTYRMMLHMKDKNTDSMMKTPRESVTAYKLKNRGEDIGTIHIITYTEVQASYQSQIFKRELIENSILIGALVIIAICILSRFLSKSLENDLKVTETLARNIDLGIEENIPESKIEEIKFIQLTLKSLHGKIKIKQKVRKQLLDQLVHQTRTPLTILKTHLEAYEDGILDIEDRDFSVCIDQIDQIELIISNMSEMIENEKIEEESKLEEVNLKKLLLQIVNGLKVQFKKKNIQFDFKCDGEIKLNTDRYKLSQSIYNLVTNAYKFTKEGGCVSVILKEERDKILILINDTGIGIEESEIENIFEPYYRGNNVEKIKGEGIGLYIAKENIESLNGEIKIKSKIGKGTSFKIILNKTKS